jgi:hypothetical protein
MIEQRARQIRKTRRKPDDKPDYRTPPPDRADKAAYLMWLFVEAQRDHLDDLAKARARKRAQEWAEERERERLKALKGDL